MKRVKMILLSLLVLSAVGGIMPFKAKFRDSLCTTPVRILVTNGQHVCTATAGVPLSCPYGPKGGITIMEAQQFNAWCTTTPSMGICNQSCVNQVVALTDD